MADMEKTKVIETEAEDQSAGVDGSSEKLFTQDEVNKIVEARLNRYKAKKSEDQVAANERDADLTARAADLTARESRLACREYVITKGYDPDLLDIIGTADVEDFKAKADKLAALAKTRAPSYPVIKDHGEVSKVTESDDIAHAFSKAGSQHVPKKDVKW
ncbi:MAG: hypothetical protein J5647_00055 [Spirochaetaceae bacterium]|nr:hypothetical protein [Spirochaetaceae bacterium]